jgi:di/tricarboxylate transporter
VGLVEEEHQLRLVEVADLRQLLEQLGQQPQQEGGVERGACISLSAASTLITPRPSASVCIRSLMSSIGSPKNTVAALLLQRQQARWMAPIEAVEMLPYSVVKVFAFSPTCWTIARRSLRSSSSRPWSSAILNTMSARRPGCR